MLKVSRCLPQPGSGLRVRHDCVRRVQIHKHLQKMGLIIPILDSRCDSDNRNLRHGIRKAQSSSLVGISPGPLLA
jgi:hypothetical protein